MRKVGVVASGSTTLYAPIQVFKNSENEAREESLVVIDDASKKTKYLGILRNLRMNDPLLPHSQRSSIIDNPDLAKLGTEVIFVNSYVRILGELEHGFVNPSSRPPAPRSLVYLMESPSDVWLNLGEGLIVGKHKYSYIEVPISIDALRYHVGVIGATGTGKSRLVLALVDEVLRKTDWKVIVFDHSGLDYAAYFKDNTLDGGTIVLDIDTIHSYLKEASGYEDKDDYVYYTLLTYVTISLDELGRYSTTQKGSKSAQPKESVFSAVSEKLSEVSDIEDLLAQVEWNIDKLYSYLGQVLRALNAKEHTRTKIEAKLFVCCREFIASLNSRKTGIKELIERANRDRLVVIDLSPLGQTEKKCIVKSVLTKLWQIVDSKRVPVNTLVVIDEAHNYACEYCGEVRELIKRTAREGRKWGVGLVLASQRIIDFATEVRNNINTFFFSRLQTPSDLDNLRVVLDLGGVGYENLAVLGQREFFVAGLGNPLKYPVLLRVKDIGN